MGSTSGSLLVAFLSAVKDLRWTNGTLGVWRGTRADELEIAGAASTVRSAISDRRGLDEGGDTFCRSVAEGLVADL